MHFLLDQSGCLRENWKGNSTPILWFNFHPLHCPQATYNQLVYKFGGGGLDTESEVLGLILSCHLILFLLLGDHGRVNLSEILVPFLMMLNTALTLQDNSVEESLEHHVGHTIGAQQMRIYSFADWSKLGGEGRCPYGTAVGFRKQA